MWTWFLRCVEEGFVNCRFLSHGECQNPRHKKENKEWSQ